ncbi:MAG: hypothetical protein EOO92_18095 [Pedobacter sp.]|nr:MAG: hypothetical protein EOO92_18095 [Pedobacter sp.]
MSFTAIVLLFSGITGYTQTNNTKLKDGSVASSPLTALPGAVFELESITRGFLAPRMTTQQRNAIAKANLTDGLLIYNTTTACFDYYKALSANSGDWFSICGTPPPATFTITSAQCNEITSHGTFLQGKGLDASNYLSIPLTVSTPGSYSIRVTTNNGYYFEKTGIFTSAGTFTVNLPATGKPVNPSELGDEGSILLNEIPLTTINCKPKIKVSPQVVFSLICEDYSESVTLGAGKSIGSFSVSISVNVTSLGAYSVSTEARNGVSFSASGTFTNIGSNTITLLPNGTPESTGEFNYAISSNSGAATCNLKVNYLNRTITVLGLGQDRYQPGTANNNQASRAILTNLTNFGSNGVVKVDLQIINGNFSQDATLKSIINSNNIDIIVIGYNYLPNAASITVLDNFIKRKKGVLIHSQENDALGAANLINTITGGSAIVGTLNNPNTYLNILSNISDPILTKPFIDLKGKYAGVDLINSCLYISNLPGNMIKLGVVNTNPSLVYMAKHSSLGYVFVGDAGWTAGEVGSNNLDIWPASISAGGNLLSKLYFNNYPVNINSTATVHNSFLYANTIAWAIEYVKKNTNPSYIIP